MLIMNPMIDCPDVNYVIAHMCMTLSGLLIMLSDFGMDICKNTKWDR